MWRKILVVDLEIKEDERTNFVVGFERVKRGVEEEEEEEGDANENGGLDEAAAVAAAEIDAMGGGGFRR